MQTLQSQVIDILNRYELYNGETVTTGMVLATLTERNIIATRSQVQRILNRFATRGWYKGWHKDRVNIKHTQFNGSYVVSW